MALVSFTFRLALGFLLLVTVGNLFGDDFQNKTFTTASGKPASYELWAPKAYDQAKTYPLDIYTSSTQRADSTAAYPMDENTLLANMPGGLTQFPVVTAVIKDTSDPADVQKVVAEIASSYHIDPARVAIRGLSTQPLTYVDSSGATLPYELFVPPNYDKSQTYPILFFFHGAGERGTDNLAQLRNGALNYVTPAFQSSHPCLVVYPQCPGDKQWVDMPWSEPTGVRPPQPSASMQLALKVLDSICSEYSIDKNREYVMGLSMGGYATWDCVTRFPDRFAAGIICCGGGDENTVTSEVARVPVWVFHSSDDPIVPVARDRNMVAAMAKAGGHPRYIEYNWLGHGSWGKAFDDPELFNWLFQQRFDQRPPLATAATK